MSPAIQILQALALRDPAYPAFFTAASPELSGATLSPDLAEDIVTYLCPERPDLSDLIAQTDALSATFNGDAIAAIGAITAAMFLLRSHIKITRDVYGKCQFLFEYKPADNDLLKKVLDSLKGIVGR